jgi:hypothetical protein
VLVQHHQCMPFRERAQSERRRGECASNNSRTNRHHRDVPRACATQPLDPPTTALKRTQRAVLASGRAAPEGKLAM